MTQYNNPTQIPKRLYGANLSDYGLIFVAKMTQAFIDKLAGSHTTSKRGAFQMRPFASQSVCGYDVRTKQTAVKPSRHPLAIFVPKFYGTTHSINTTGTILCNAPNAIHSLGGIASCGGLIDLIQDPAKGNKSSHLFVAVDTRSYPYGKVKTLTKQTGEHTHA